MSFQSQKFDQPEEWANFVGLELITNGMTQFFYALFRLFIKIMASLTLVFLRARTGSRFISISTLFWGWQFLGLFAFIETMVRLDMSLTGEGWSYGNVGMLGLHLTLFGIFGIYRFAESRRNLRSNDGEKRFSEDPGYSILWPIVARLLAPMGLVARDDEPRKEHQLNEYLFQKFVEPALVLFTGLFFQSLGYGVYAFVLIASALSSLILILIWEENYFRKKQEQWDAKLINSVLSDIDEPVKRERGMIVQQTLLRTHDNGFREWKARQQESYFEAAESRTDREVRIPAAAHH